MFNDDSLKTIELITKIITDAIIEGLETSKIRTAEENAENERFAKENETGFEEEKKRVRIRRQRRSEVASDNSNPTNENNQENQENINN